MEGLPGHHPPARSAAPRVPPAREEADRRARRDARRHRRARREAHQGPPRVQPDARPPRLPPRDHVPRDLRDAGARDPRGGGATSPPRASSVHPGDHDPARDDARGARAHARHRRPRRRARSSRTAPRVPFAFGTMIELPRAARARERARAGRGVLLVRHQRPHAVHAGPLARRRGQVPPRLRRERHPPEGSVRHRSTSTASARS